MDSQNINAIFVYNINQKDKIIGKLKNISKEETLQNIRPNIRKMTQDNEFISINEKKEIKIIDKDIEDEFTIEDILINEKGELKIYINGFNKSDINNKNSNVKINDSKQNGRMQIYNNNSKNSNFNSNNMNNFDENRYNPLQNKNQFINNNNNNKCLNPMLNNRNNNINNMKFINNINNNMNNMNNINNLNNMNNMNNMNYKNNMMIFNSQNFINSNNNKNNNFNEMNDKMNHSIKKYNVTFKESHGFTYFLPVNYYKRMDNFLGDFLREIHFHLSIDNDPLQLFYKGQNNIPNNSLFSKDYSVEYYFKNEPNPIIFVNDTNNLLKIINVTFKDNHGNQVEIIVHYNTKMYVLLSTYLEKIDHFELNKNELSKKEIQFLYNKKIIEFNSYKVGEYFNIENIKEKNNITIFVNDKNNSIKIKQITFRDNHGDKVEIMANKKNTIRDLIMRYLGIVEHWELIEREGDIQFLYNQKNLDYNDKTSIEEYFKNEHNPIVKVNDFYELLLKEPFKKYYITFKTSQGFTENLSSFLGSKMEKILGNYLNYIGHPELINDKSKITFLYKAKIIDEKIKHLNALKMNQILKYLL